MRAADTEGRVVPLRLALRRRGKARIHDGEAAGCQRLGHGPLRLPERPGARPRTSPGKEFAMSDRPVVDHRSAGGRPLRADGRDLVGSQRPHAGPAPVQPGSPRLYPRRGLPAVRARSPLGALPRRARHPRRRLRRRRPVGAPGPSRRPGDRSRSRCRQYRGRPAPRGAGQASRSITAPRPSRAWRPAASASTSCWPWRWWSTWRMSGPSSPPARAR